MGWWDGRVVAVRAIVSYSSRDSVHMEPKEEQI